MKKKRKSVCYKKFDEFPEGLKCCFCTTSINDSAKLGDIYKICDVIMHYFCLLSASEIEQRGDDKEALLGFYTRDIKKEIARGLQNTCFYCNKKGATVSCFDSSCDITFHLPCGLDHGSLHQYFDSFRSYCRKHKPKQAIPPRLKKNNLECPMCITTVNIGKEPFIWPPCCKPGIFLHKICCQKLASNSGYSLKCPMCNNKDDFVNSLKKYGIFIPDQEATWELEEMNDRNRRDPEIVECLAEKYDSTCKCPKGKLFSVKSSPRWYIEICVYCGGGMHLGCMPYPLSQGELYKCELCVKVDRDMGEEKQSLSECSRPCEAENEETVLPGSIAEAQSEKKDLSKKFSQSEIDVCANRTSNFPSVYSQSSNKECGSQLVVTRSSASSFKESAKNRPSSTSTMLGALVKSPDKKKQVKRSPSSNTVDNKPVPAALPLRRKRNVSDKDSSSIEKAGHPTTSTSGVKKPGCKAQLEIHDDILIIISSDSDSDSSSCKNLPRGKCQEHGSDVMMLCRHTDMIRRKRGQLPHDVPTISVQLDYDDSGEDLPSVIKEKGKIENFMSSTTAIGHELSTRIQSRKLEKSRSNNINPVHSGHHPIERRESSKIKKYHKTVISSSDPQSSAIHKSGYVEKLNNAVQAISDHQASTESESRELRSNAIRIDNCPQPPAGSKFREFNSHIPTPQIMERKNELLEKSTGELKLNIDSVCSLPAECWTRDNDLKVPPFLLSSSRATTYSEVITLSSESEDEGHLGSSISYEKNQVTKSKLAVTSRKRNTPDFSPHKKKTKHSDTNKTPQRDDIVVGNEICSNGFNENINYPNHQFKSSENICRTGDNNSDEKRAVKKMRFTTNNKSRGSHVESLTTEHLSYPPLLSSEFPLSCISQDSRKRLSYGREVSNLAPTNSSLVSSVNNTVHNFNQIESLFKRKDMAMGQLKEIQMSNNVGLCKETMSSSSQDTMLVSTKFNFPNPLDFAATQTNDLKQKERRTVKKNVTQDPLANGISFVEVSDSSQLLTIPNKDETSVSSHENLHLSSDFPISSKECRNKDPRVLNNSPKKESVFSSVLKSSTSLSTFQNCSEMELSAFKIICANEEESTSVFLNGNQIFQDVLHPTSKLKYQFNNDSSLIINNSENIHLEYLDESVTNLTLPSVNSSNLLLKSSSPIKKELFYFSKYCSSEIVVNKKNTEIQDYKLLNERAKKSGTSILRLNASSHDIIENSIPEVLNNILSKICPEDNKNCKIENKDKEFFNSNSLTDKQTSFESYPIDGIQMEILEKNHVQILCEKLGSTCLDSLSGETQLSSKFQESNICEESGFDGLIAPPTWYPCCSDENCSTCKNSCDYINSISLKDNEVIQHDSEETK